MADNIPKSFLQICSEQLKTISEQNTTILNLKANIEKLQETLEKTTQLMMSYALLKDCSSIDMDYTKLKSCIQELETFDSETYELLKRLYMKEGIWQIKK
nr:MAG TPA: hypothetical protein [Caudoviricetes sp.]